MKYLLVVVVVVVVLWLTLRSRPDAGSAAPRRGRRGAPTMVSCAHCGVHLPPGDAVSDAGGRSYCSEAHRVAGPR